MRAVVLAAVVAVVMCGLLECTLKVGDPNIEIACVEIAVPGSRALYCDASAPTAVDAKKDTVIDAHKDGG